MTEEEHRAALTLADQARKGNWSEAALADVLASLGMLTKEQVDKVAERLHQNPDPNYDPLCPASLHPAKGNLYRAPSGRLRCTECANEQSRRKRARAKAS